MKFEKKIMPDHQIEVVAECEPEQITQKKVIAARKISSESKIPGFRPGKAPYDIVKNIYGDELIEQRAIELLIDEIYPLIIKEAEIKPYGPGKLDEIISKDPPKFKFTVPLEATVEIGDYKSIRYEYLEPHVSDEEIQSVLDNLQLNYATAEEVSRNSEKGDLVSLKMNAYLTKPEKDQDPQILKDTPHQVIIGEESKEEQFPFNGFSEKFLNLPAGETIEFKHKYSKDTKFENLKVKEVSFSVTIENIKKLIKPDLNDDFAKNVGFDSYELLKESVKNQLEESKRNEYENEYFNELIARIKEISKIMYPPQMLDDEISDVTKNFEKELATQNLDLETYLKINNLEKSEFFDNEIKPAAQKRLEEALIIEEISRQEKIELDRGELEKEFSRTMAQVQSAPNFRKLQKTYTVEKLSRVMAMQTATRLMNRQTLQKIKALANGEIASADSDVPNDEDISNKNMIEKNE